MNRYSLVLIWILSAITFVFAQTVIPKSSLLSACRSNNLDSVQESLAQGADVNATDQTGSTPLMYAVSAGNPEITELLLKSGARQNVNDSQGNCPVILAVQKRNVEVLRKLAAFGGDLHHRHLITYGDAQTPLQIAVQHGDLKMAQYLISEKVSLETRNSNGESALMLAASMGNLEMVKVLVENGAYLYATRGFGGSLMDSEMYRPPPLIKSYLQQVEQERQSVIEEPEWVALLEQNKTSENIKTAQVESYLQQGRDPHGQDKNGRTLLHHVAGTDLNNSNLLETLLAELKTDIDTADIHGMTALHLACRNDRAANVKVLLEYGASVDVKDHNERTPLIVLAKYYHSGVAGEKEEVEIAQLLLDMGADVNATDALGNTPLLCLAKANMDQHLKLARMLIEHGADVNRRDYQGNTFLHGAAEMGTAAMMELAIQAGADLNTRNYYGKSILDITRYDKQDKYDLIFQYKETVSVQQAVYYSQAAILDRLIQDGVDINAVTDYDNAATGLIIASKQNDPKMTRKLLELGATIDGQDAIGSTALHYAAQYGFDNIVAELLDSGANVTIRNKEGWRALDLAGANERHRVIQLFKDMYPDMEVSKEPVIVQQKSEPEPTAEVQVVEQELTEAMAKTLPIELAGINDPNTAQGIVPDPNHLVAQMKKEERKLKTEAYVLQSGNSFHIAVIKGGMNKVREMISAGQDVHQIDAADMLALNYAVLMDNREMVNLLLENKADINRLDSNGMFWEMLGIWGWGHTVGEKAGWGTLHYVTAAGSKEMLEFLINKGADVNLREIEHGNSPIFMAIAVDRTDMLKILVDAGADLKLKNKRGRDILNSMAGRGKIDYLRVLLELGDIDVKSPYGGSMLRTAAAMGEDDIMIFLLEQGADINAINTNAVYSLLSKPYTAETLRILIEYGIDINAKTSNGKPLLFNLFNSGYKIKDGLENNVQLLLESGIDVNASDKDGNTILHHTAKQCFLDKPGALKIAELMIAHGADVNLTNVKGKTALQIMLDPLVRSCGSRELIRLFAENNTTLNEVDRYGRNSLHNAAYLGWADVVILLASKGAHLENYENDMQGGKTPLHTAVFKKQADVVKALLEVGADVSALDKQQQTPLFTAVREENIEIIQLLLDYQADCNIQDKYGSTPLHTAVQYGNKEAVKLLLEAGARTDIPDRSKLTAPELAQRMNKTEILELFQ